MLRIPPLARLGLTGSLLAAIVACTIPERTDWTDQLQASSPCYDVDLLDGLDESSTAELRALYACLDYGGTFDPLDATVESLERPSRDGVPAGVEIARLVNRLADADIDPFGLAGVAFDLLKAEDRPIGAFLDLALELIYGASATRIRAGEVSLGDPGALEAGLLVPLAPVLVVGAGALLDDDLETAGFVSEILQDPETKRYVRTFGAYTSSQDTAVARPIERLLPDLGKLILATRDGTNDTTPGASGDSLRDLALAFATGNNPVLPRISDEADAILGDAAIRTRLEQRLGEWHADGRLDTIGAQIAYLASVDVDGEPVRRGGDVSGLHALVRMLHDTNRPMDCSLDLWVTDLEFSFGNLAVSILGALDDLGPDTVQTGIGVIGWLADFGLSRSLMEEVADSGVCPALTPQVIHDLESVDLLYEDPTYDLLVVFIDLVDTLENGEVDRKQELADLATDLYETGGVEPMEELLRDVGREPALDDAVDLLPVFLDPEGYGITAGEEAAVDLQDLLTLAVWIFEPDQGVTGWERIEPLVVPILEQDGTYEAALHLGNVLAEPGSQSGRALELIPPLLAVDPDLVTLDTLAPLIGDEDLAAPLLRVVATPEVPAAILSSSAPVGASTGEVPMAFGGRLITDGTMDEALATVDVLLDGLERL